MNIHYSYWAELGFSESQLENPQINIHVGALIIKRIQDRMRDPRIAKIASVYNVLGGEQINKYGIQVENIYRKKSWKKC